MKRILLVLALGLFAADLQFAAAENSDAERGRLPDGRAFRTDVEGTQVVDYIAELEVTIEQLNRRVLGLEDEIRDKKGALERLESGRAAEAILKEKNLLAENAALQEAIAKNRPSSCDDQVRVVKAELDQAHSDVDIERQLSVKRSEEYESTITNLQATIEDLKRVVEAREAALKEASDRAAEGQDQAQAEKSAVAAILTADPAVPSALPQEQRASLSIARLRAVESIRGKLLTELNQLKGLIATRDQNFRVYSQKRQTVAFRPSVLVARSGRDVAAIQQGIQAANAVADLSVYRRDISEIEAKAQDDLALMSRMAKVN